MTPQGPLNSLFPEIYHIIAGHLPLNEAPSALFALALTNPNISEIVLPLLYSRLALRNKTDAIRVLQKLVEDPPFGRVLCELHIMTAWSLESYLTGKTDLPLDVIRLVQDLIIKGYLPFIHTLDLQLVPNLSTFCNHDAKYPEDIKRFNQLGKEVAAQLKDKCPWLRVYILKGFASDLFEPWFERSDILQALVSAIMLNLTSQELRVGIGHNDSHILAWGIHLSQLRRKTLQTNFFTCSLTTYSRIAFICFLA